MRAPIIVGLGLAWVTGTLRAQQANQIEFGVFGTFTRFDHAYNLPNRAGGGFRFGYFLSDFISLEGDGIYLGPSSIAGKASWGLHAGSASLVLHATRGSGSFYALGGVSRIDMGTTPPYNFSENGVHGGFGIRFLVGDRVGLRIDGRAFYRPGKSQLTGLWTGHIIGTAGLSYTTGLHRGGYVAGGGGGGGPVAPGEEAGRPVSTERQYQWYWGGQGGAILFKTNIEGYKFDPIIGGHWLITARRTALYVAYEQGWFLNDAHAQIQDPNSTSGLRDITFHNLRRLMFGVLAFPAQKRIEPLLGGGFALMQVLNPLVDCSGTTPNSSCPTLSDQIAAQNRAQDAASKAFFWLMGGMQLSQGKMSLFGHYVLTSSAKSFLISGTTGSLQAGLRYSIGTSKEGITEAH